MELTYIHVNIVYCSGGLHAWTFEPVAGVTREFLCEIAMHALTLACQSSCAAAWLLEHSPYSRVYSDCFECSILVMNPMYHSWIDEYILLQHQRMHHLL